MIENARITGTMLGSEDHDIFTAVLNLKYGGSLCQGFGTYPLDNPVEKDGKFSHREGTAYGLDHIMRILDVVGVRRWEDLVGKHIRVDRPEGWGAIISRIGHITEDKWFDPKAHSAEWRAREEGAGDEGK